MDAFEELLRRHRSSGVLLIDPEQGWGDQLILMGLEKKLRTLSIKYRVLKIRKTNFANKALASALDSIPAFQAVFRAARPDILENRLKRITSRFNVSPARQVSKSCVSEDMILLRGGAYLNDIWMGYGVLEIV
jgi:exopolysaccharide biosynthesis predicted pyruvyltransferase EpsI